MTEILGEEVPYNQPLKLRDEIHTGKFTIRQAHGQALPVKQTPECNLAVKIVEEREWQMTAEGDIKREEVSNPLSSSSH